MRNIFYCINNRANKGKQENDFTKMKKILIGLILIMPMYARAQNVVFNPGFDMVPWDTGWTVNVYGNGMATAASDTGDYYCYLYGTGGWNAGSGEGMITQIIPASKNCTCRVYFRLDIWTMEADGEIGIEVLKNSDWIPELHIVTGYIDSSQNWNLWEKTYDSTDIIQGIRFYAYGRSYHMNGTGSSHSTLCIDDVYIGGTIGVEESSPRSSLLTPRFSASPNPFTTSTTIKLSTLNSKSSTISTFDISGKLVEQTDNPIIGKDLKKGIYFVKVNNSKPFKIIKAGGIR